MFVVVKRETSEIAKLSVIEPDEITIVILWCGGL
jgi:hypothetical protein